MTSKDKAAELGAETVNLLMQDTRKIFTQSLNSLISDLFLESEITAETFSCGGSILLTLSELLYDMSFAVQSIEIMMLREDTEKLEQMLRAVSETVDGNSSDTSSVISSMLSEINRERKN